MFKSKPITKLKLLKNVVFINIFAEVQIYTVEREETKEKKQKKTAQLRLFSPTINCKQLNLLPFHLDQS